MKERPILFNAEMVRALLDGRRTQTRRPIKPQPEFESGFDYPHEHELAIYWKKEDSYNSIGELKADMLKHCPFGQVGDRLWVKETFLLDDNGVPSHMGIQYFPVYKADYADGNYWEAKWRPSIHMPRWASRITLDVVAVRVERVQEISEGDVDAEGLYCPYERVVTHSEDYSAPCYVEGPCHNYDRFCEKSMQENYKELWNSIYGKTFPWESNPWVWVVEFKGERG